MKRSHRILSVLTASATVLMLLSSAMPAVSAAETANGVSPAAEQEPAVTTSPYYPEHSPWVTDENGNQYPAGTNALWECRLEIKEYPQTAFAVGEEFNTDGLKVFLIEQRRFNQKDYDVTPVLNIETDYDPDTEGTYTVWLSTDYQNGEVHTEDKISYEVTVSSTCTTAPYETTDIYTETAFTTTTTTEYLLPDWATEFECDTSPMQVGETRAVRVIDPAGNKVTHVYDIQVSDNLSYSYEDGSDIIYITALSSGSAALTAWAGSASFSGEIFFMIVDKTDYYDTTDATGHCVTDVTTWSIGDSIEQKPIVLKPGDSRTVEVLELYALPASVKPSVDGVIGNVDCSINAKGRLEVTVRGTGTGMTMLTLHDKSGLDYFIPVFVLDHISDENAQQLENSWMLREENISLEIGWQMTLPIMHQEKDTRVTAVIICDEDVVSYDGVQYYDEADDTMLVNLKLSACGTGKTDVTVLLSSGKVAVYHVTAAPNEVTQTSATTYLTGSYHTGSHVTTGSTTGVTQLSIGDTDSVYFTLPYNPATGSNIYDPAPTFTLDGNAVTCEYIGVVEQNVGPFFAFRITAVSAGSANLTFYLNGEQIGYRCYFVTPAEVFDTTVPHDESLVIYVGDAVNLTCTYPYDEASQTWNTDVKPHFYSSGDSAKFNDLGIEYDGNVPYYIIQVVGCKEGVSILWLTQTDGRDETWRIKVLPAENTTTTWENTTTVGYTGSTGSTPHAFGSDSETTYTYTTDSTETQTHPVYTMQPLYIETNADDGLNLGEAHFAAVTLEMSLYDIVSVSVGNDDLVFVYADERTDIPDRVLVSVYSRALTGETEMTIVLRNGATMIYPIYVVDSLEGAGTSDTTTADGFGTGTYPTDVTTLAPGAETVYLYPCVTDENGRAITDKPRAFSEFGFVTVTVSDLIQPEDGAAPYYSITISGVSEGTDMVTIDGRAGTQALYFKVTDGTAYAGTETTATELTTTTAPITSSTAATSASADLPQTGRNNPAAYLVFLFAMMLSGIGCAGILCARRKEEK